MSSEHFQSRNRLLGIMSHEDLSLVTPYLTYVVMDVRTWIERPHEPIPWVYFMERGIASVVAGTTKEWCIESGLIGREGVTGSAIILGGDQTPNQNYIQVAGAGQRMASDDLRSAMAASPTLRGILLRYVQAFLIQTAHTGLSNGRAKIEERLARWLLMAQDRLDESEMNLTHEFMSLMLGVRRPGVTDTLHQLEGRGLIRSTRGVVRIIDREGLKETAAGSYGVPEAEYERLLG